MYLHLLFYGIKQRKDFSDYICYPYSDLQLIMIYVMPMILGVDGLWAVVIAVEGISLIVTVYYILKNRKNYGYMK